MDLKDEVAGITFLGGVVALALVLAGLILILASLLPLTVGIVLSSVIPVGFGNLLSTALLAVLTTTVGIVGLLLFWAAVESGYFEPDDVVVPADEPGTEEPEREESAEAV